MEKIDQELGPNKNGESAVERVKRFCEIVKAKTAKEREQILDKTSDILKIASDEDLDTPEHWARVESLKESSKRMHKKIEERGSTRSRNDDVHYDRVQTIAWWAEKGEYEWESATRRTTTIVSFLRTEPEHRCLILITQQRRLTAGILERQSTAPTPSSKEKF